MLLSLMYPYDIVQIFLEGEFIAEGEGSFYQVILDGLKQDSQLLKELVTLDLDFT